MAPQHPSIVWKAVWVAMTPLTHTHADRITPHAYVRTYKRYYSIQSEKHVDVLIPSVWYCTVIVSGKWANATGAKFVRPLAQQWRRPEAFVLRAAMYSCGLIKLAYFLTLTFNRRYIHA